MSYKCLSILQGVFSWRQLYFVPWILPSPCHALGRRRMGLGSSTQDPSPKGFGLYGGYRDRVGWNVHCRVSSQQWPFPEIRTVLCWAWRSCCQGLCLCGFGVWVLSAQAGLGRASRWGWCPCGSPACSSISSPNPALPLPLLAPPCVKDIRKRKPA